MRVIYLAHPVSGDVEQNLRRTRNMIRELTGPGVAIIAPWITECEIWDDANPKQRAEGLARDMAVLERCDELWLTGPKISPGMRLELEHAKKCGLAVVNLTPEKI